MALPFIVFGSTLYALLPAMEFAPLGASRAGADAVAVQAGFHAYTKQVSQLFYFGDNIDYQVNLSPRSNLRVITPPAENFSVGDTVQALIHPRNCVVVRED